MKVKNDKDIKYCLCTEGYDKAFPYLRVMLVSFLEHNSKWFNQEIVIFTCDETPLSIDNRNILSTIYDNIRYVNIDFNRYRVLNLRDTDVVTKTTLYRLEIFQLIEFDFVMYINCLTLCRKDLANEIFIENSNATFLSHYASTRREIPESQNKRAKGRPNIRKNLQRIPINSNFMLLSKDILNSYFSESIINDLMKFRKLHNQSIHVSVDRVLKTNNKVKVTEVSNLVLVNKSVFPDSKSVEFASMSSKIGLIYLDIGIDQRVRPSMDIRYRKINDMWISYSDSFSNSDTNNKMMKQLPEYSSDKIDSRIKKMWKSEQEKKSDKSPQNKEDLYKNMAFIKKDLNVKESDYRISIIIPAYKAAGFIEQCLSSILKQNTSCKIEILIGIDNCSDTLLKLKSMVDLPDNVRIYHSEISVGPYVIRNSLISKTKYENLLFFDADDIMMPHLISSVLSYYSSESPIRFKYLNFTDPLKYKTKNEPFKRVADGVFFINKKIMERVGGFQGWLCGADTEFIKRCELNGIKDIAMREYLFYRRLHRGSLTQKSSTNHRSAIRKKIKLLIKRTRNWSIPIEGKIIKLKGI